MAIFEQFGTTAWEIYVNAVEKFVGDTRPPLYVQPLALVPRKERTIAQHILLFSKLM